MNDLSVCPISPPVTSTNLPGISPWVVIQTKAGQAFRNFTCLGGAPATYTTYQAELADTLGLWSGKLFYDSNGFPTYNLVFQDPYNDFLQHPRTIVTYKEYIEIPNPNGTVSAARYKVLSDTASPPFSYIERTQTTGGIPPAPCASPTIAVEYTAIYNLYMCRDPSQITGSPAPAPSPAIIVPSPVPASSPTLPIVAPNNSATPPPVILSSPPPVIVAPTTSVPASPPPPVRSQAYRAVVSLGTAFALIAACIVF